MKQLFKLSTYASILAILTTLLIVAVSGEVKTCARISSPENGFLQKVTGKYYIAVCQAGYTVVGKSVVWCKEGQWDSSPPICVKNTTNVCNDLTAPENGEMTCDEGPHYAGRSCRFKCSEGFRLMGVNTRMCMWSLSWSGKQPTCIPQIDVYCDLPPPLKYGKVIGCSSKRLPRVGTTCSFLCNSGYTLQGPSTVVCRRDGKLKDFSGKTAMPECIALNNPNTNDVRQHGDQRLLRNEDITEKCHPNYFGAECDIYCAPRDDRLGHYTCDLSGQKICRQGYIGPYCRQVDFCLRSNVFCRNGGTCVNAVRSENRYVCKCTTEFMGTACEIRKNPCQRNPCENGGTCLNSDPGQFSCQCLPQYSGSRCESFVQRCGDEHCMNHGACYYYSNTITCVCSEGFFGNRCEESHTKDCEPGTAGCEPICNYYGRERYYQCRCKRGYSITRDKRMCLDIDECAHETLNRCQFTCNNFEGGYTCSCPKGYHQVDEYKCEGCKKNSYWLEEAERCENCPHNSYTTSEGKTSIEDCICLAGYEGKPEENSPCQDIDECGLNNFGCSNECVNTPGSAFCSCTLGYTLDFDNKTCIDIDECSIKNGGCQGICHNSEGSFECSCSEGYVISNKDHFSCDDIDECLENNGGCAQKCNNYPGGHYCSCEDGFRIDGGLQNCKDIRCPAFPIPHFSTVRCKKDGDVLVNLHSYPIGAVCGLKCNDGFKKTESSSKLECQEDGTWKGTLSQCKSLQCPPLDVPENGDIHPSSCSKEGTGVKQICTFTCRSGYKLKGKPVLKCKNDLTWSEDVRPVCQLIKTPIIMKCPEDISLALLPGKDSHNVTIPALISNAESLQIQPDWVTTNVPILFPAGETDVIFRASNSDDSAECITRVHIMDKEPPVFNFCPEQISIEGAGADGVSVTWDEPEVTDNVDVVSVQSTLDPNSTLTAGTYIVEYIAKDAAGNSASCSFDIDIEGTHCSDLADPVNGEANCLDWMIGKICRPLCDTGYSRFPRDPQLYTCDDTGEWEPSDIISDCLMYIPAVSSTCPDGYELTEDKETEEEICVECPNDTHWSASTKKCEETVL